jgi:plastocyanin
MFGNRSSASNTAEGSWLRRIIVATSAIAALVAVLLSWSGTADSADYGKVKGTASIKGGDKEDNGNIVITIEDVPSSTAGKLLAEIAQKDKQFNPGLTVVTTGSKVEFPNQDKIFHNVFSVSEAARFDLGLYKSGESKTVKLRRAGVIDVYCNIHPEMVAQIKVVDTKHFAVTGSDGSFEIDGIPPGTYPIVAWQQYGEEYRGKVTVTSGGTASVSIELEQGKKPKRHTRKDGTAYPRYK